MGLKSSVSAIVICALSCALCVISCNKDQKDCPAFSDNLVPYIPNESRMVFFNAAGDSLLFRTEVYDKSEQHTVTRNRLSVGGTGAKPYCRSSCSLSSSFLSSDANQVDYSIDVDNEADTCALRLTIRSGLPSIDYFFSSVPFAPVGKVFGDTLQLTNFVTTTNPRFSAITIVHGRGIVRLTDEVENCVWSR
jgi:hypothetical protein